MVHSVVISPSGVVHIFVAVVLIIGPELACLLMILKDKGHAPTTHVSDSMHAHPGTNYDTQGTSLLENAWNRKGE